MATSLEDETQQPSFYNQLSSPGFGTSPDQSLPFLPPGSRPARTQPPSSPIAESSATGFLQQQLNRPADIEEKDEESLRESALDRQTQAVVSGNLLRVGVAPQGKKAGWTTAPTQAVEAGPSTLKTGLPDLGVVEVDELASSSMPGQSPAAIPMEEEESGNIPSPPNSSPPAGPSNSMATRKRKDHPSPGNGKRTTPSKPPPGHLPISAHSPARPSISKPRSIVSSSSKPIPRPPPALAAIPPLRPASRGPSKAKKQKVTQESPDSFAGPVHRPIRKASEYFESANEQFQIPKEMQSSGGRTADDDDGAEEEETDQADKMVVDGQEDSLRSGVGDNGDKGDESIVKRSEEKSEEASYAAGLVETYMSQPGREATPESSHLSASTEDASINPILPPPRTQDPPPAQSSPSQSLPPAGQTLPEAEQSYFGRPRRGFMNFGMSLTQESPNTSRVQVNRNELFSSPADGIASSPSQSQGWSNLPPTQARMLPSQSESGAGDGMEPIESGAGDGMESTQKVSEESQQRAQVIAAERNRTREEEQKERDEWENGPVDGGAGLGETKMSSQNGGREVLESIPLESVREVDSGDIGDTQLVSAESMEKALEKRREAEEAERKDREEEEARASRMRARARQSLHPSKSAPETQDATFQSRRSDDQPTQMANEESCQVEGTPTPARPTSPVTACSPIFIPLHRRLQRRVKDTRSDPQPLPTVHASPVGSVRSRTDPAAQPASRLATPPATPPQSPRHQIPTPSRFGPRGQPSPFVSVNIQTASPGVQGPSSSMQEAEDMLQLGVITQMSEPEVEPSPSPPIRGGSARRSGRARKRPTVFTPTPDSPAPVVKGSSSRAAASRPASPTESEDSAEEEEVNTLPPPPVLPSPVKTYGTRRSGPNLTPAKPPTRRKVLAASSKEDIDESPDPLASPFDQPEGISRDDRMEVDEPPEPESPPTPQDTEDYSYRPLLPARASIGATSKPGKKPDTSTKKSTASRPDPVPAKKFYNAVNKFPSSNLSRPASSTDLSAIVVVDIPGPRVRHTSRAAAEASKSAKKAKVAIRPLDEETSDLSEPESPPTPQDPDDETFKISKKASEAAMKGKKPVSRQTSVVSTSASAGPSKSRPAKKAKKGRGSNLSVVTADTGGLTPTQTSSTEKEGESEEEEEDVTDKPFVLAYFDQMRSYYAAHVLARVGDRYRVEYLDQLVRIVKLDEMRKCALKIGDRIKFGKGPMKRKAELEIGKDWSEDGLINVKDKKGVIGDFEIGEIYIPASTIMKLFEDRKVPIGMLKDLLEEEEEEDVQAARKTSGTIVHKVKTGTSTFADKIFLITPTDDTTASLRNVITKNGGTLCDWGDLFQATEFGQSIRTDLGRTPFLVTPAEIDGEKSGMKAKSMIALSFGIPCLHHGYIEAALNNPNCDWIPYLLPPGKSVITGLPASQIVDLNWGKDDWAVRAARHLRRPLANKRLLFMDLTPKGVEIRSLVATSAFGLGAISFRVVPSLDNIEEADYDYLILSNCSEKDRKKKEKEFPRGVKGNKKACDVKWLKQVMISSTCPPPRLYTYES